MRSRLAIIGLVAVALAGCGGGTDEEAQNTGPLADAAKACGLAEYAAEVTGDYYLRMQLPRREPDWPDTSSDISCISGELGGPPRLGEQVFSGDTKGSAEWTGYKVEWDRKSRSNGSGDITFEHVH